MQKIYFIAIIFLLHVFSYAQTEIYKDTIYFLDNNKVMVVHTTNRQYYDDSTCVWEVMYPEIFGLENRVTETSINIMLSQEVAFGDCNDKECDRTTMHFPQLSKYWDKVKITGIKYDLLSYGLLEGHCPVYSKLCSSKIRYYLYDMKSASEIETSTLFKKDENTQHKLDSIVLEKLDFVPEDINAVRSERQFYFEGEKLFIFYDSFTLRGSKTYSFELHYEEVKNLINPSGKLSIFFKDNILSKK